MYSRPTWEESFMYHAIIAATRSSCLKRPVGACLIRDKRIIASGYNGAPPNVTTCLETQDCRYERMAFENANGSSENFKKLREEFKIYCNVIHAEKNAYNQCSLHGPVARGAELFVTNFPCPSCVRDVIIPNKTKKVVVWKSYLRNKTLTHDEYTIATGDLRQAGIPVEFLDLSDDRIREIHSLVFLVGNRLPYEFDQNFVPIGQLKMAL